MASQLIPLVAAIIAIGVAAQILADRFEVPSIVFLLAAGIALGPEGLGVITRDSFASLPAIVGLSVAIIVFEGAFHLRIEKIRQATSESLRLVTVGAAIALVGTAIVVRYAVGTGWGLAFLIGALLVATGPTVITPILRVVPVRDRVAVALETEGIVNDVTAAILAVVVFKTLQLEEPTLAAFLGLFVERFGGGVLVGVVVAVVVWFVLRYIDLSPGDAPRNARLVVLAGALVAFGTGETIASEAGVAAAATAGVVLGNLDVPYEQQISDFKGDVTLIVLSFVFIALAALLELEDLLALGVGGVVVVFAVIFVIRPLLVYVSTVGGDFSLRERLFVGFVGPRGIIPASVATLFAVELQNQAAELRAAGEVARAAQLETNATLLVGTVFLVILSTVALQGGFARYIAERLDVIPMRVLIIGGGRVGRELARRLEDRGENVVVIENDEEAVEQAREEGFTVQIGDGTNLEALRSAGGSNASTIIAATGDDDTNLLIGRLAATKFDTERVICRANQPENLEAFEDLDVDVISSSHAVAQAIDNVIERPAMQRWSENIEDGGDVQEIAIESDEFVGRTVDEVGAELPGRCLIALVTHGEDTFVPDGDYVLDRDDRITVVGEHDAVREAMAVCRGD
ncbi:cation:proton antiporter domain-containing protein [Natronomonas marina]|uniref:cation:proton antiporter domain-containing protein n=1 Tax=Natronomonas marina TaxID=2961939 RepID=UPI0020CA16E9|nr:cation:proton antiporter [Natronomonas marina]